MLSSTVNGNGKCQVCGDNATIVNYGALSCLSCRTFFRRNGICKKNLLSCRFYGNCEITILTRKICTACRLTKCLAVGMSTDLIRKVDSGEKKRKSVQSDSKEHVQYQSVIPIPKSSALDRSSNDSQICLSNSEWNMISNVVHAFDTFSPVSEIRRTIEMLNKSNTNQNYDFSQSLKIMSSFSNALQSFISSTPDFKILPSSEQNSLFQRNIIGLLSIGGIYLMRESGASDKPDNHMTILPLYGHDIMQQKKIICPQLDCDPTLFKLLLIIMGFSSSCYTNYYFNNTDNDNDRLLLGTFRLFGSQNAYVELIWKYLTYRYSYYESVRRFSKIIRLILHTGRLSIELYENNEIFRSFVHDTINQFQQTAVNDDKLVIPLWGRN